MATNGNGSAECAASCATGPKYGPSSVVNPLSAIASKRDAGGIA